MKSQPSYQQVLVALSKASVRYLVAGGIAMNIHGLERSTFDLDLIIFLERKNILKFAKVMSRLGYHPKIPVKPEDFADEKLRKSWIKEKNMVVFSFYHQKNPLDLIDIFVYHPRPFDKMFKARKSANLRDCKIHAVGLKDMLFLKQKASRPKDQFDIRFLETLIRKQKED
ncbi:MAG: hypothetical protein Q7S00_06380 [bacterium]|nr:hypothetical protein [bacterium]